MAVSDTDIAFATDLFADLGPLTTRKMMGGLCLYHDGTIFALLKSDGSLWIKGAGAFQDRLNEMGAERWTYTRPGRKAASMPYWRMPDAALDDPGEAVALARAALAAL